MIKKFNGNCLFRDRVPVTPDQCLKRNKTKKAAGTPSKQPALH